MNNKAITKMLKKTATVAMLTFATAAPLLMTAQHASAATYTASKYFPGTNTSDDNLDNEYYDGENNYFRNFKHRSANLYVKDKKLKKVFQKAAKAWAPVFKFKFVNSPKHADFNSAKYANVIVKKDGGSKYNCTSVNKIQFFPGSMKNLKKLRKDFPTIYKLGWYRYYIDGKITNYKKWKTNQMKFENGDPTALMGPADQEGYRYASKIGMWIPSTSNARKNSWNHYITVTAGTRNLTQKQQIGNATETLGEIIGIGQGANSNDLAHENDDVLTDDTVPATAFYNYKVTQSDLDHVDWIYAHPWSGSNYFWDNRSLRS